MALYAQSMLSIRIHKPIVLLFHHHFLISLQRTVIVPPEAGYDKKGMNEIPVKPYSILFFLCSIYMKHLIRNCENLKL